MRKTLGIILLLTAWCVSAYSQPYIMAFGHGEVLQYEVSYKAKLIPNTPAGIVVVRTTKNDENNTFTVSGNGKVLSQFKWFFDINDTYTTVMDATTLLPVVADCELREGKYHFVSTYRFDWNKMEVNTTWQNMKRPNASNKTMPLKPDSFDAVSLFYNLRTTDVSKFKKGEQMNLEVVLEDTIRTISYRYLGRETKKIKGTGTYKTLKFAGTLATSTGESFEDGTEFFVWISDDNNRIPIFVESPVKIGSIRARLTGHSGLIHKLDSRIK